MRKIALTIRPKHFPVSFQLDRRVPLAIAILSGLTLGAMVLSLGQGEYFIPPADILKSLLGLDSSDSDVQFILMTLRLPRLVTAWLVGVGLAIAGTILQSLTRNPLAEPGIIGINAGAALAAVSLLILLPSVSVAVLPLVAFAGALGVTLLIYWVAWQNGSSPLRLILVGIGFNLIAAALTNLLVTFGNINHVSQALIWLVGSVYGRSWEQAIALMPWIAVGSVAAWGMSKELNSFQLGDDFAQGLGVAIEGRRAILILISTAIAGASVATAGAIGFVGLIAPHLARQWVGSLHQGLIPTAALTGGFLVVAADLIGRLLFAPLELPCGIITAIIGAPYFLYLLIKNR